MILKYYEKYEENEGIPSFAIQTVHDTKVPKTTSLTPLQNRHDFNNKVVTLVTLFGQIRPNSILSIFFVDISKHLGRSNVTIVMPNALRTLKT